MIRSFTYFIDMHIGKRQRFIQVDFVKIEQKIRLSIDNSFQLTRKKLRSLAIMLTRYI